MSTQPPTPTQIPDFDDTEPLKRSGPSGGSTSMRAADSALAQARRFRTENLYLVTTGQTTVIEVLRAAAADQRLRSMSLRSLLMADPSIGDVVARRIIATTVLIATGSAQFDLKSINVGWLVSANSAGRRWEAFCQAVTDPRTASFPLGFPYRPTEVSHARPATS